MKKEFYNLKYGKCKLLDEKKDLYLVYAENCELHYIVCIYIDNMGTMMGQNFFKKLNQATLYFNKGA